MKETKKKYWKGLEQLTNDPGYVKYADREFAEKLPLPGEETNGSSRRDFLKMMGFSIAAASVAACEAPVRKAIPYLNKPVDVDPGIPNYYASTYASGGNYCSILVKTREGRPIKIEGNTLSDITRGGTSAQVEASVLSLYDDARYKNPTINGESTDWDSFDADVKAKLAAGPVRVVTNTVMSPSTRAAIDAFVQKYPSTEVVTYDTQSAAGILKANEESFGKAALPSYDFSKANVIVSFDADFLATWLSPIEYAKQYSQTRKINSNNRSMSRHYHYESNLSVTGANADFRVPIKPSRQGPVVAALYNAIASKAGAASAGGAKDADHIKKAADELWANRGKSLVVSGSNDPAVQVLVNAINDLLNNYGSTIDLRNHSNYRKGDDASMTKFVADLKSGSVASVIFMDCNPIFNHPRGAEIAEALSKSALTLSTAGLKDETAEACSHVAPTDHFLESWGDVEPRPGVLNLVQPTITRLFDTRQSESSLLSWAGQDSNYFEFVKARWKEAYYPNQDKFMDFQMFWDSCLHDGVYTDSSKMEEETTETGAFAGDIVAAASSIASNYKGSELELALYFKAGVGDGTQANNPWLQEMPDPITKATWDNYVTVSQSFASANGIVQQEGIPWNMVNLTVGNTTMELPVIIQPGQAPGTIGLALGYGRTQAGKVADNIGKNAYPLTSVINGHRSYYVLSGVTLTASENKYQVARTQTHETYMGRDTVIQEATLEDYKTDAFAGRHRPHIATWQEESGESEPGKISLWKGHEYPDHHWGLAIDLNSCTGCGACTIACQVENNIPVVGREEVINRREMHWIRIDRYYSSDADAEDLNGLEKAAANPEVTFQPMMCQHCNNAPCETVCPVAATTHSTEGLNMMAYNRCIGTRYCANNCPYKVRRFNWFKYHDNKQFSDANTSMNSDLGKMVLNPDVTVRSRGVMEKCSLCVQRIQYGKLEAKKERRKLNDSDINTACASACPADAIVFGDIANPESKISKMLKIQTSTDKIDKEVGEERAYAVLEEIGVKPNVLYLTKIRNKDKA